MKVKVSWFSVNDFEGAKKFYGQVLRTQKTFEAQQWAEFAGAEGEESIGVAVNPHAGKEPAQRSCYRWETSNTNTSVWRPPGCNSKARSRKFLAS